MKPKIYTLAPTPPEPECRVDGDCPSRHACINQRCQNPCIVRNPCTGAQTCVVEDSLPIRTVACVCPDGFVVGTSEDCVKGNWLKRYKLGNAFCFCSIYKTDQVG